MSDVDAINLVRIQETDAGLELMGKSINEWVDAREKKDARASASWRGDLKLPRVLLPNVTCDINDTHGRAARG